MIRKVLNVTAPEIARDITEAKIGPTQGVQRSPSVIPRRIPDQKLGFVEVVGERREIFVKIFSVKVCRAGIIMETPKKAMTTIANIRSESEGMPRILTIVERKRVKKVKLKMKPKTIPSGRARDGLVPGLLIPEERIIGKTGKIQGERIVTNPARKANKINIIIRTLKLIVINNTCLSIT